MGIWYIITWTVRSDKMKEHDELIKKWMQYGVDTFEYFKSRNPKQFKQKLSNRRIAIYAFDNLEEYEKQMAMWNKDPEFMKYQNEWYLCVETNYQGFFWEEMEY